MSQIPDPAIETMFVPELRRPIDPLPADATLAQVIERVNLLSLILDQSVADLIGDDGQTIETRTP